jgi:hypothetical protein
MGHMMLITKDWEKIADRKGLGKVGRQNDGLVEFVGRLGSEYPFLDISSL